MGQVSKARGIRRVMPLAIATLAFVGSSAAVAAKVVPAADNGAMKFSHVTVVNAPAVAASSAPASGMRAYKDNATSAFRGPSPEEMQAAAQAGASTSALRRASVERAAPATFAAVGGGVGALVDESYLQYSVVVRQPDGSLAEICVTGRDQADEVIASQPVLSKKEIVDVR